MRKRYLMEECRTCADNDKSLAWCFDCCSIPYELLEYIEESNKVKEKLIQVEGKEVAT